MENMWENEKAAFERGQKIEFRISGDIDVREYSPWEPWWPCPTPNWDEDSLVQYRIAGINEDGLLPCPFCGEYPTTNMAWTQYDVECSNNECNIRPMLNQPTKTRQEAINQWNTRIANGK